LQKQVHLLVGDEKLKGRCFVKGRRVDYDGAVILQRLFSQGVLKHQHKDHMAQLRELTQGVTAKSGANNNKATGSWSNTG